MGIGLVLSGGGAKGAAHIGVIQALLDSNINIDYISGTSSGSIIASLYAMGYSTSQIREMFLTYCKHMADIDKLIPIKILSCFFSNTLCVKGICKGRALEKVVAKYANRKMIIDISDIKLPIAIPTVDLKTGEVIYFLNRKVEEKLESGSVKLYDDNPTYYYDGKISEIVRSSCSLPAVYVPKNINNHMLVDGGIRENTPVSILKKMGAQNIVAVTFDSNKQRINKCNNILSITMQSFDIMSHQVNQNELELADVLIRPNVEGVLLLGCDKINECIENGYNETLKHIEKIKKLKNENSINVKNKSKKQNKK